MPLTGCSAQQNIQEDAETVVILPANQKTAYVTTPVDGRDGAKIYFRSGVLTAMIVADAFAPYFINLTLGSSQETRDEALASARSQLPRVTPKTSWKSPFVNMPSPFSASSDRNFPAFPLDKFAKNNFRFYCIHTNEYMGCTRVCGGPYQELQQAALACRPLLLAFFSVWC